MDRIRAGLTGLGAVFLITAAASLLFAPTPAETARVERPKEPGEPLSQLGVAPNSEKESAPPAPVPAPDPQAQPPAAESPVNGAVGEGLPGVSVGPGVSDGDRPVEI